MRSQGHHQLQAIQLDSSYGQPLSQMFNKNNSAWKDDLTGHPNTVKMAAPANLTMQYVIGIITGICSLVLIVSLMATWWYCKRRQIKCLPADWSYNSDSPPQMMSGANLSISQSTPNLAEEYQYRNETPAPLPKRKFFRVPFRQATLPTVPHRHQTFQRQLSHKLDLSNIEFTVQHTKHKEQPSLGMIKPELYKQASQDSVKSEHLPCGILHFGIKYDHEIGALFVNVYKADELPAKDFSGTSDPYVKIYLLPDRKNKFQTKVHRKTLNPEFNESFIFTLPYQDLADRTLQFSVYDFDRFSRHDLIGTVLIKDMMTDKGLTLETHYVKEILAARQEKVDLGDLMLSLCYLPTAGRLTVTVVKARNLKAMDITGLSDPFVKVLLMCQDKRIKKKKTSVKKNTLNPVYNEALVYDVPQENVEEVWLIIKVIDYDRIGNNELIGCCPVGPLCAGIGHDHWYEMLDNARKPIAQWYPLQEQVPGMPVLPETPNDKLKKRNWSEGSEASSLFS